MPRPPPACSSCSSCSSPGPLRPGARSPTGSGSTAARCAATSTVLAELGIPVEGQRGVGGGYRDAARVPAAAADARRRRGGGRRARPARSAAARARRGAQPSTARSAKIDRVLPTTLRRQVEALEETLDFTSTRRGRPAGAGAVLLPGRRDPPPAAGADRLPHVRRRARRARAQPVRARRPLRALVPGRARPLREDLRTFRVDRMRGGACRGPLAAPPEGSTRSRTYPSPRPRAVDVGGRGAARPPARRGGRAHPRDAGRARRRPTARSCGCGSTRSTGWRPSSPASTAVSRSAARTSCAQACARSAERLAGGPR